MKISYDIRGKYPEEINEEFIINVINNLPVKKVVIGYDSRESSKKIAESIKDNLEKINKTILWLGNSTTPFTSFAGFIEKTISIMITASHLSNDYNGLKISENGFAWEKEKYLELLEKIKLNNETNKGVNSLNKTNEIIDIREKIIKKYKEWLKFKNEFFESKAKIELRNNEENPGVKLLKEIGINVINNENANFEFDSDCDRLYCYLNGKKLHSDLVGIVLAKHLTKKGDNIVFNVGTSILVYEELNDRDLEMVKTGRNNMIKAMNGAKFGFEYSGHFYFYDKELDYYLDDGLKALSEILKIDSFFNEYNELEKKTNISEEIRVKGTLKDFEALIRKIKERAQNLIDIDGFRFEFFENNKLVGFFLIRQSNTEEKVSIRFEHKNKEKFEKLKKEINEFLKTNKN
ncbi:MAG: hypothetical protein ABGW69_01970 [Nanoarchaeota archaeon]